MLFWIAANVPFGRVIVVFDWFSPAAGSGREVKVSPFPQVVGIVWKSTV